MEIYGKIKKRTAIFVALLSFLSFLLIYLRFIYVFEGDFWVYASYFLEYVFQVIASLFVGIAIISGKGLESKKRSFLTAFKLSLPRLIYLFPYYYLYYLSDGFDSIEAIILLNIRSIFLLLLFSLEALLYYFIADFAAKKSGDVWDFFKPSGFFDFSKSVTAAIFAVCFTKFILNLFSEGLDILVYLIEYEEFYSLAEIYYLLGKVLLAFATLFISHVLFMLIRKKWARIKIEVESKDTEA